MAHATLVVIATLSLGIAGMAQAPRTPDVNAQRAAMKKLSFLLGKWSGEATLLVAPGQYLDLTQTEEAQFKLDGLVLMIEGVGRRKSEGKPTPSGSPTDANTAAGIKALGLISFDDESGAYHMRAFNNGRWLESEVKLASDGNGLSWGFTIGDIRTNSVLRINEKGEWTEDAQLTIGTRPPQKLMSLTVRRLR
jgi:hypothetical protein